MGIPNNYFLYIFIHFQYSLRGTKGTGKIINREFTLNRVRIQPTRIVSNKTAAQRAGKGTDAKANQLSLDEQSNIRPKCVFLRNYLKILDFNIIIGYKNK
jgi:hypothetical protein